MLHVIVVYTYNACLIFTCLISILYDRLRQCMRVWYILDNRGFQYSKMWVNIFSLSLCMQMHSCVEASHYNCLMWLFYWLHPSIIITKSCFCVPICVWMITEYIVLCVCMCALMHPHMHISHIIIVSPYFSYTTALLYNLCL